jgi:hypothetical protein
MQTVGAPRQMPPDCGLAALKACGRTLGHPRIEELRGKDAVTLKAEERVPPQIETVRRKGLRTLRAIAAELEPLQVKTLRGGKTWVAAQVANILKRKRES